MYNSVQLKVIHEKKVIGEMIALYCRKKHGTGKNLCAECAELYAYAQDKIDRCRFIEKKTFCSACTVHCYSPDMRTRVKTVMRFSGPRMFLYHPVLVVKHILVTLKMRKHYD